MRNPEARGLHESNARNIVMAIAVHKHIAWSPTQIASFFGRHTSDVEFAKRRISKAIALRTNTGLQRETERVCKALGIDPSHLILKK